MAEDFYTADPHFGHANIIKYCMRTMFMNREELDIMKNGLRQDKKELIISKESLDKMNEELIRRWNERVKPIDTVFVAGDFCFRNSPGGKGGEGTGLKSIDYENRLNGKIIFIKGNHDKNNSTKTSIYSMKIHKGRKDIKVLHNYKYDNLDCKIVFCGHVHTDWKFFRVRKGRKTTDYINLGVDQWNYYPITFNEVMAEYNRWLNILEGQE